VGAAALWFLQGAGFDFIFFGRLRACQTFDAGSVTLTVNGQQASASYGQSDTAATVAGTLATSCSYNQAAFPQRGTSFRQRACFP